MFDEEKIWKEGPPMFADAFADREVKVISFLISGGFVARDGCEGTRVPWERATGFGAVLSVYPKFDSYNMVVDVSVYAEDRLGISVIKKIEVDMSGPDETWKEILKKKFVTAIERGMAALHVKCPHCGNKMRERKVRAEGEHKGKIFYGCEKYPQCRGAIFPWNPDVKEGEGKWAMANCPDCNAPLVVRYAKQGRNEGNKFYGCKRYPKCKRIVSDAEIAALRLMQGDDAREPWNWADIEDAGIIEIK